MSNWVERKGKSCQVVYEWQNYEQLPTCGSQVGKNWCFEPWANKAGPTTLLSCHPLVASYKLTDVQDPMLNSNYIATAIISKGANDTFNNPSCSRVVFKLKGYNETPTNQLQLISVSILQVYIKILI